MRNNLEQAQLASQPRVPVYVYLAVPISVLVGCWQSLLPEVPGRIALMMIPVLMAAVEGGLRSGFLTGLFSALSYTLTAWGLLAWRTGTADLFAMAMPIPWAAVIVSCGAWFGRCVDIVRQRAIRLQERCDLYERSMYQFYKDSDQEAAANEKERAQRDQAEAQRLDFSKLLLNIQHIGRELSGNLQMNAVFRLVTDAAKKLLKAPVPRLFLVDGQTGELVEHTPEHAGARYAADRGMLGWVVRNGQIITAEDVDKNYALADMRQEDKRTWLACAPLVVGQRVLGVLGIDAVEQNVQEFDSLLYIVANFSAVALNNAELFQRVEAMAHHDGLTGLLNHATFQSRLAELHGEAQASGQPLALVLSDVDHFKQFNDRYGHQAGDYVLQAVAKLWKRSIPSDAIAARYGGEEFVCVLPGSGLQQGSERAETLRFALENEVLEFNGTPLKVTSSFGVAVFPVSADSAGALIRAADAALYAAKRAGRNRVCVADPQTRTPTATAAAEPAGVH